MATDTIDSVKARIEGIPVALQRLVFDKIALEDGARTLQSYNVQHNAVITLSKTPGEASKR